MVEYPLRYLEVMGSIHPGPSHTKDFKMVLTATLCNTPHIKGSSKGIRRRVAPDYAADSPVLLLSRGRNAIENEIESSTNFVDYFSSMVKLLKIMQIKKMVVGLKRLYMY